MKAFYYSFDFVGRSEINKIKIHGLLLFFCMLVLYKSKRSAKGALQWEVKKLTKSADDMGYATGNAL